MVGDIFVADYVGFVGDPCLAEVCWCMEFIDLDRKKIKKILTDIHPNCEQGPEELVVYKAIKARFYFIADAVQPLIIGKLFQWGEHIP